MTNTIQREANVPKPAVLKVKSRVRAGREYSLLPGEVAHTDELTVEVSR